MVLGMVVNFLKHGDQKMQLKNLVLLEYKRDITIEKMGNKLMARAQENNEKVKKVEQILDDLEKADPTKNKQYVEWLCRQYIKGQFRLEDYPRVKLALERFGQVKQRLPLAERDVGRYDFNKLEDKVDELFDVKLKDENEEGEIEGLKVLYDGPLGLLGIPTSREAACAVGSGTKWCTAASNNNLFSRYNKDGPLFYWKDKSGQKYQFHFASNQFMNSKDQFIGNELFKKFRTEHPVLKKLFAQQEKEILKTANDLTIEAYANRVGGWPEAEQSILSNENLNAAVGWARRVKKGRWKEAEPFIAKNPKTAFEYANTVINGRWEEAEKALLTDPAIAARYAIQVLRGRWKEAEKVIVKDDMASALYANAVRRGRLKGEDGWR